ncbi:MAG: Uncharacterized protein G01um10147_613 [Microgenomates group bacterium Gr01-1014_7]|nr:MAG: Uncharacterized protein G01um10147_613 [Microgenomates group bacterium Gr01-1014_7]
MKKEELLKFYLNYRLYIFPTVAFVCSLILLMVVIYPQLVKLLSNERTIQDLTKRGIFLEAKAEVMENYDISDLDNKIKNVLSSYPADKDFAAVIGVLQNLTAQAGFNIVSLSLGGGSKETKLQSYGIKLDLLGPVKFLPILINNIEHSPRLMRVSSIEATTGKDAQSAVVTLNVEVLYAEVPKEFGSADSPLPELSQKDEEVLAALAGAAPYPLSQPQATPGASLRGKPNPFE